MTKVWLSLHVIAAIVCIGPVTIAASLFPRYARAAAVPGEAGGVGGVLVLHRISRVYAVLGISVPVLGLATGAALGVLGDAWLSASMALTAIAAAILVMLVLPGQRRLLEDDAGDGGGAAGGAATETRRRAASRLAMHTGIFNLLWAIVVVLMIVRPGSTTSA